MNDPIVEYQRRYESFLRTIAANLQALLQGHLADVAHIDRISARAKDPARFAQKARKTGEDGQPKYRRPLT